MVEVSFVVFKLNTTTTFVCGKLHGVSIFTFTFFLYGVVSRRSDQVAVCVFIPLFYFLFFWAVCEMDRVRDLQSGARLFCVLVKTSGQIIGAAAAATSFLRQCGSELFIIIPPLVYSVDSFDCLPAIVVHYWTEE